MECLLPQLMFNLENIKGFTDRADKMSSIVDYTDRSTCIILEMVQYWSLNHEGLGITGCI
jgi:hypothetical protein